MQRIHGNGNCGAVCAGSCLPLWESLSAEGVSMGNTVFYKKWAQQHTLAPERGCAGSQFPLRGMRLPPEAFAS
ncbi:hypothetical protein B5E84_01430 [Lachnoclostridium sp. An14]|nr:hypothetical protein B5E84_01430 [Lachnoclostridium sp. An14]